MYICSVIQSGQVIHQQSTSLWGQINEWIKEFKTSQVKEIHEGRWELQNHDGTRIMLVTW